MWVRFCLYTVDICLLSSQRDWKDMINYLYHPPGLAGPFYKVCEMVFVSCFNAFYWSLLYSFLYVNKLDLWHCRGISLILIWYYSKVSLRPEQIGKGEQNNSKCVSGSIRTFWCGKTTPPYEGALLASFTPFNKSLSRRYIHLAGKYVYRGYWLQSQIVVWGPLLFFFYWGQKTECLGVWNWTSSGSKWVIAR